MQREWAKRKVFMWKSTFFCFGKIWFILTHSKYKKFHFKRASCWVFFFNFIIRISFIENSFDFVESNALWMSSLEWMLYVFDLTNDKIYATTSKQHSCDIYEGKKNHFTYKKASRLQLCLNWLIMCSVQKKCFQILYLIWFAWHCLEIILGFVLFYSHFEKSLNYMM